MTLPADKEAIEEIMNPKYFCEECGARLWNLDMVVTDRALQKRIGPMPKIQRGFYTCLNHVVHVFKCPYYEHPIPEIYLKRWAKSDEIHEKIKTGFNSLVDEIEVLKKKVYGD